MALPSSGKITLDDLQNEFGGVNPIGINEYYGADAGVPTSGVIALSNFYGKSRFFRFTCTISGHTLYFNLRNWLLANGWNGSRPVQGTVTINSGVHCYSNTTSASYYGFRTGALPAGSDVTVINHGYVFGAGGAGGAAGTVTAFPHAAGAPSGSGGAGGRAFCADSPIKLYNYGYIYGGGGGGGGSRCAHTYIRRPGDKGTAPYDEYGGLEFGGGGGGAGRAPGAGGGSPNNPASAGSPGSHTAGGAGYIFTWEFSDPKEGSGSGTGSRQIGGHGGGPGAAGGAGLTHGGYLRSAGAGGSAGYAIVGDSKISWLAGNDGTRVRGLRAS